jgi:hypothetical protein
VSARAGGGKVFDVCFAPVVGLFAWAVVAVVNSILGAFRAKTPDVSDRLPEIGPRWSERQGKSTTNAVQPPGGMTEADEPDQ